MKPNFRTEPTPEEQQMPFASDLLPLYRNIGSIAGEYTLNYPASIQSTVERIFEDSADYQPGGKYFDVLQKALSDTTPGFEECLNAGLTIGSDIAKSKNKTRDKMLGFLNACFQIDRLKLGLHGFESSSENENFILYYLRLAFVETVKPTKLSITTAEVLDHDLQALAQADPSFGWFIPKATLITQEIGNRVTVHEEFGTNLAMVTSNMDLEAYGGLQQFEEDVDTLFSRIGKEKKYGVKPAYMPAAAGGSWVFYDGYEFYQDMLLPNRKDVESPFMAVVFHSPKTEFESLELELERLDFGNGGALARVGGALNAINPDTVFYIDTNGQIFLDAARLFPLNNELAESPKLYAALAAELYANLHDLTVPIGEVESRGAKSVATMSDSEKKKYDPILDLLVPRLKRVKGEHDEAAENDTHRTVREHNVTYFPRRLPAGCKPSPQALELARKHSMPLGPHETFVRAHKRGTGNPVRGHKIS